MAFGGWLAGAIYDYAGFYGIAFATGILFNLLNLALIGALVWRQRLRTGVGLEDQEPAGRQNGLERATRPFLVARD